MIFKKNYKYSATVSLARAGALAVVFSWSRCFTSLPGGNPVDGLRPAATSNQWSWDVRGAQRTYMI